MLCCVLDLTYALQLGLLVVTKVTQTLFIDERLRGFFVISKGLEILPSIIKVGTWD